MRYVGSKEPPYTRGHRPVPLSDPRAQRVAKPAAQRRSPSHLRRLLAGRGAWAPPLAAALALAVPCISNALPPKPSELVDLDRATLRLRADVAEARKWGLDQPHPGLRFDASMYGGVGAKRNALVILIDFSDNQGSVPPSNIENLLFSVDSYSTGSMRDYYLENSYGLLDVTGQVVGWFRSERTYSYYVDGSRGLNFGNGDRNARGMAMEALRLAEPHVDFSWFDNDGPDGIPSSGDDDGYIDALMVVHAGPGSEETLDPDDILSHQAYFTDDVVYDGVRAILYTTEPENGSVGVFCHEFGHTLGLPDLYDIRPNPGPSVGLGRWSLMATGVWLNGGRTPAHLDAWSKVILGFADPVVPEGNAEGVELPTVEEEPAVYKIWTNGRPGREYFLAELRTKTGFDSYLPGEGVLIYHVDESVRLQEDPNHYKVALEQADGLRQLETMYGNHGDTGDPFPGATLNRSFTPFSNPWSLDYDEGDTQVWLTDIDVLDAGGLTVANFDVQVETEPAFVLEQVSLSDPEGNGDGYVDVGEPGLVLATIRNLGLGTSGVEAQYEALAPEVELASVGDIVGVVEADSAFTLALPFTWSSIPEFEAVFELPFTIVISDGGPVDWSLGLSVGAGTVTGVFDDFETGEAPWSHGPVTDGRADAWAWTDARARSGSYSWVFGGGGGYPDLADGALVSRPVLLAPNSQLVFFYWVRAESLGSSLAWDGGRVEMSIDGGAWAPLVPYGGYDFTILEFGDTPLANEGALSGSRDWTRAVADLSEYSGMARFRFRFVSDDTVTDEGLYIDDFAVTSRNYTAGIQEIAQTGDGVRIVVRVDEVSGPFDGRGFDIYRKIDGAGGGSPIGRLPPGYTLLNAEPLEPDAGGTLEYLDVSAEPGRVYLYVVEDLGPGDPAAPIFMGPERVYLCLGQATAFLRNPYPTPYYPGGGRVLTLPLGVPDPACVERELAVRAHVFDAAGRLVRELPLTPVRPGLSEMFWDGRNEDGDIVRSGIYLWRVEISGQVLVAKTIIIR